MSIHVQPVTNTGKIKAGSMQLQAHLHFHITTGQSKQTLSTYLLFPQEQHRTLLLHRAEWLHLWSLSHLPVSLWLEMAWCMHSCLLTTQSSVFYHPVGNLNVKLFQKCNTARCPLLPAPHQKWVRKDRSLVQSQSNKNNLVLAPQDLAEDWEATAWFFFFSEAAKAWQADFTVTK